MPWFATASTFFTIRKLHSVVSTLIQFLYSKGEGRSEKGEERRRREKGRFDTYGDGMCSEGSMTRLRDPQRI